MSAGASEAGEAEPLAAVREARRLEAVGATGLDDPEARDSLHYLTSLAVRTLPCSTAFVSVVGEEQVLVRSARGEPAPLVDDGPVPVEESFCQYVVAADEPLVVRDASREGTAGSDLAREKGLFSFLEVPLRLDDGTVIGGFCIGEPRPRDWTDEDVRLVETFAAGASSEIRLRQEIRRLREREGELEHRALHDPVTGLANRHLLRDRVRHALARSERTGTEVGVLFLDVDDFKTVNDRHGHTVGDDVLASIGARLRAAVREHDTPARFGGDEFVVLVEDLNDPAEAEAVAGRIAASLREPLDVDGECVALSVSIGVAVSPGREGAVDAPGGDREAGRGARASVVDGRKGEATVASRLASRGRRLIQEADWAMYRAKRSDGVTWVRY